MMKLDVVRFGVTLGCIWSLCTLGLALASLRSRKAERIVQLFSKVYRGFEKTLLGIFLGAVWGFIDGMISGLLVAWVINKIVS